MAKYLKSFVRNNLLAKHGNLVSLDDHYETIDRLLVNHEVKTIIDAGASDGRITRKILPYFPKANVYLFEPQGMYREKLLAFAEKETRAHPQFMALGNESGEIALQVTSSPGCTSVFKPSESMQDLYPDASKIKDVETVPVVTIDEWVTQQGLGGIDVMKFDIQGGELNALQGASNTLTNSTLLIYTEVLFNPLYEGGAVFGDIDACLREHGFQLYNLYKPKVDDDGMLLWANAIFIHKDRVKLK